SFGCVKTISKSRLVRISKGVKARFSAADTAFCASPALVKFKNETTGDGLLNYSWDFGDGQKNTATDPSHNYTANGSYTVKLIARSSMGCSDTATKSNMVHVGTKPAFVMPDTVCAGQAVQFSNTSFPVPVQSQWSFGDGTVSTAIHAIKTYTLPGKFIVRLVSTSAGCKDSIVKTIVVMPKPAADFEANARLFCSAPATVSFQSKAIGILKHLWLFGDGKTSNALNPVHTYTSTGKYTVTLIVTNASGCSDTLTKEQFIVIQKPQINISGLPQTGCVPLTVKPTASISTGQAVQGYLWKFGDGTTSNAAAPTHVYQNAGNYNITLVVTMEGGCKDSITITNGARGGNKPNVNFTALPPQVCNEQPVQFLDSSVNADQWLWV
ncbi:MAG TPA: PKD domain-containing protein, partial [Chitinophagaceae bacterium]|nr:PKD domain-containing protein [Chitinophagaceae bacterium]